MFHRLYWCINFGDATQIRRLEFPFARVTEDLVLYPKLRPAFLVLTIQSDIPVQMGQTLSRLCWGCSKLGPDMQAPCSACTLLKYLCAQFSQQDAWAIMAYPQYWSRQHLTNILYLPHHASLASSSFFDGVGDGEVSGDGDGEGDGEGDGVEDGEGDGERDGEGDGEGDSVGDGVGDGEGDGVGDGVGEEDALAASTLAMCDAIVSLSTS